jgi:hypothetical protein
MALMIPPKRDTAEPAQTVPPLSGRLLPDLSGCTSDESGRQDRLVFQSVPSESDNSTPLLPDMSIGPLIGPPSRRADPGPAPTPPSGTQLDPPPQQQTTALEVQVANLHEWPGVPHWYSDSDCRVVFLGVIALMVLGPPTFAAVGLTFKYDQAHPWAWYQWWYFAFYFYLYPAIAPLMIMNGRGGRWPWRWFPLSWLLTILCVILMTTHVVLGFTVYFGYGVGWAAAGCSLVTMVLVVALVVSMHYSHFSSQTWPSGL